MCQSYEQWERECKKREWLEEERRLIAGEDICGKNYPCYGCDNCYRKRKPEYIAGIEARIKHKAEMNAQYRKRENDKAFALLHLEESRPYTGMEKRQIVVYLQDTEAVIYPPKSTNFSQKDLQELCTKKKDSKKKDSDHDPNRFACGPF